MEGLLIWISHYPQAICFDDDRHTCPRITWVLEPEVPHVERKPMHRSNISGHDSGKFLTPQTLSDFDAVMYFCT